MLCRHPLPIKLTVGSTQQLTAIGTYSNGSTADVTSQVTWASSNDTVAYISSSGSATGVAPGTASITAALSGDTSRTVTLNVTKAVPSFVTVNHPPRLI